MNIKSVVVGSLDTNCYILEKDGEVLIIDPGAEEEKIIENIAGKVVGIIITHHHFDHVGAMDKVVDKYKCKVYDRYNLIEGNNEIDEFKFEVIYTPGHKEDLITIYFKDEGVMFTGDFLFKDSIGRCDLEGSNTDDMINSINKIKKYPRNVIVYPGHGVSTTIGYEMDNNIYFRSDVKYI